MGHVARRKLLKNSCRAQSETDVLRIFGDAARIVERPGCGRLKWETDVTEERITDAQWAYLEPFVIETGALRGRPPRNHRRLLDGIFWLARTSSPWSSLPEEFGKRSAVYGQFYRWTQAGLWDILLEALAESDAPSDALRIGDSTIIKTQHSAADTKEALTRTVLAIRAMAPQQKFLRVDAKEFPIATTSPLSDAGPPDDVFSPRG